MAGDEIVQGNTERAGQGEGRLERKFAGAHAAFDAVDLPNRNPGEAFESNLREPHLEPQLSDASRDIPAELSHASSLASGSSPDKMRIRSPEHPLLEALLAAIVCKHAVYDTMAHDGFIRKLRCRCCLHRWIEYDARAA